MRLRIHHPLFAGFLGVVSLLVVLIVLFVGSGLRRELRGMFEAEMERHLALADVLVAAARVEDADSIARLAARRIGYRVTLVAPDGRVLADSSVDPDDLSSLENHAGRPEIAAVLAGEASVGFAERVSVTVGESLLYGARMSALDGSPVVLRIAAPQTRVAAAVRRMQRSVTYSGALALLVALAAAYALSVAFARPLVALADRARRLGRGDVRSTVPHSRVLELRDVSVAFNRLADELRARLSELGRERDEMQALIDCMAEGVIALAEDGRLLRANRTARAVLDMPEDTVNATVGTVVRHPELRAALEASVTRPVQSQEIEVGGRHILLASRALDQGGSVTTFLDISEIRRLEKVRTDFVANASHELKTPLTSIRGYAETLVEDDPPEELRKRFLTSIRDNTLRLQRLVDDLLDLSRLESGGWAARLEPVDVRDAAEEAWDLVAPQAAGKVDFDVRGEGVVRGDHRALVQVFRNLFENAARHTEAGGSVRVEISEAPPSGGVRVEVSDDGEGIPARAIPRIFERFYRADSSRARDFGGTGLGLAIVKHLVGAMRGEISVESELGHGTTFLLRLPSAREADAGGRAAAARSGDAATASGAAP